MRVLQTHTMRGPNPWSLSHHQLMIMHITTDSGKRRYAPDDPGAITVLRNRLWAAFDGHVDQRLDNGASIEIAHIGSVGQALAYAAIQLQRAAGMDCHFGFAEKTGNGPEEVVGFEYAHENVGLSVAGMAVSVIQFLEENDSYDISMEVDLLRGRWEELKLEQLTESMVNEAIKRGIPCIRLDNGSFVQLGYGANQKRIKKSVTDATSNIAARTAGNKEWTKNLLTPFGIPLPSGRLIFQLQELADMVATIGYPIVVKPSGGNHGKGVGVNIEHYQEAAGYFEAAKKISGSSGVIVEKYIRGSDFRLLVVDYKFIAAVRRTPAMVTGDGVSTIKELIEITNSDPRRGPGHTKPLTFIEIDAEMSDILRRDGLTLESILPAGRTQFVRAVANTSAGGSAEDMTDLVHPENVFLVERVARIIGLDICGVDIISPDISVPFHQNGGTVIEVNSGPGFRLHIHPAIGKSRNVAGSVIDMLFPKNASPLVPIVAVAGSREKTIACDLIADMMSHIGYKVGVASSDRIRIQNFFIPHEPTSPYEHALLVLKDPTVDLAVLECPIYNILETGLVFSHCDIGIITDVDSQGDPDLMKAASVIPRCVWPTGHAILNADNEAVFQMHKDLSCAVSYLSLKAPGADLIGHIQKGGHVAVVENGQIDLWKGPNKTTVTHIQDFGDPSILQNVLAFILVAVIFKADMDLIRRVISKGVPDLSASILFDIT